MIFEVWKPVSDLNGNFTIEGLHDDYEGLRILFKSIDSERMCRASFKSYLCYRNIDEGDYLIEGDGISVGLFKTNKSLFVDWFKKEGSGKWDDTDITHYSFYTGNDCIEVLSTISPHVEWLN